jgi:cytoplasmic iron level regulating protein YaaA (DUF328/UPF0246 family)
VKTLSYQNYQRRLLVINCSNRKIKREGLVPAWERYQGGCFPLLKQLETVSAIPVNLDIFIISAKYGLLKTSDLIGWYNIQMTPERAESLRDFVQEAIQAQLRSIPYSQSLIFLEPLYKLCVESVPFPSPIYLEDLTEENLSLLRSWVLGLG